MKANGPWLVAVWPGMGNVAMSAGYYLLAKLGMRELAEFPAQELFDVEHVEVKQGLILPGALPRSRLYIWRDPNARNDLILFIGEAQPPQGRYAFCRRLVAYARELAIERVFTFAAMATQMHPRSDSRVFGAAADEASLAELRREGLEILEDGHIGGLNGVLLGAAAEAGLRGSCLLGEMPHIFTQLPFPKASLAVLRVFTAIAGIEIDFAELTEQSGAMDQQLGGILARVERAMGERGQPDEEQAFSPEPEEEEALPPAESRSIERLFDLAAEDRSKAYELKRELDRLDVFGEYEDRFLDLFRDPGGGEA